MLSSVSDVSDLCCNCFIWMLQKWIWILHMLLWLYTHISRACFKCFICSTYVGNISSVSLKSRSGVAHVAIDAGGWWTAVCRSRLVLLMGCHPSSRAGALGRQMPPLCASVDGAADLGPTWFSLRVRDGRGSRRKRAMRVGAGCRKRCGQARDTIRARLGAGRRNCVRTRAAVGRLGANPSILLMKVLGFQTQSKKDGSDDTRRFSAYMSGSTTHVLEQYRTWSDDAY
jgi:hypothetical protein